VVGAVLTSTYRPTSLREALEIRRDHGALPFAGGTDLMVRLRRGAGAVPRFPAPLLFLDRCPELSRITMTADGALVLGSMVTLARIAADARVPAALRDAAMQMGGPGLRTVATVGGNICNASPAADTLPFLYAWDARLRLAAAGAEREIALADFITGPGRTTLAAGEILTAIVIPAWSPTLSLWRKVGTRKANALTKVSVAAFADMADGRVIRARIALGAVAPVIARLHDVETALEEGQGAGLVARLPELVGAAVRPIDDQRSTAEYRRTVAINLVRQFVLDLVHPAP
jgi:xanthine dehydrogenase FAD-binding subunit